MASLGPLPNRMVDIHVQPTVTRLARALGGQETAVFTSNGVAVTKIISPDATDTMGTRHGVSQTVLEWIFAVIALGVLTAVIVWRYCLRYNRQSIPASLPFTRPSRHSVHVSREHRNSSAASFHSGMAPSDTQMDAAGTWRAHRARTQVRSLDVDEGGRRGGPDSTDELPAYEAGKRPPGYDASTGAEVVQLALLARPEEVQHSHERAETSAAASSEAVLDEPAPPQHEAVAGAEVVQTGLQVQEGEPTQPQERAETSRAGSLEAARDEPAQSSAAIPGDTAHNSETLEATSADNHPQ